ncbi:penicillin-binding protein 2 [Microbacterium sp. X-17]|uniref:peptidoglycan D,D-transpeptidase FtsI family protein n=1 Tax=Microbacterium sp. X-17 TaxID=3144404 RepID=UPI0031F55E9C
MTTRSTRSPRRRTVVALAIVLVIIVGFVARLVDIQVVNASDNVKQSLGLGLADSQTLAGTRGSIVDENGQPLASSVLTYDAQLDPLNVGPIPRSDGKGGTTQVSWDQLSGEMGAITGQSAQDIQAIVSQALADNPQSRFAYLKRGLSTEQYRALVALGAPFLTFTAQAARTYPDGAVAGNLVGFVGSDGTPLGGLEMSENSCLSSTDGQVAYQRGKDGVVIPGTEQETPAVNGGTLTLTINRDLQWYLQQLIAEQVQNLGAKSGTITVVEVKTGKIRAAAEFPSVDPNNVGASAPQDRASRIFTSTFEPGSTFKALTASALIDTGVATPESTVSAASLETFPGGARVRDAEPHPTNQYTLTGVLIDSSNVGISKFAQQIDPNIRVDYLKKFGIGSGSAVGFVGEQKGEIHPVSQWDPQTFYNTSFGQGLTTTVPELMGAYETIANDGVKIPLSLVESCTKEDGTVETPQLPDPTRVISDQTSTEVRQMLENVALQGTNADAVKIPGYRIGIKTGTAEKYDPATGGYKPDLYFTTMIGMAPMDDPQYLVAITLDEPTAVTSSAANAPGFQKAMTQVLKTFRVMPSTTQPTMLPKFG